MMPELASLRDIHLPALALPWLLAAAGLCALLVWFFVLLSAYRRNTPVRKALRTLESAAMRHAQHGNAAELAADLSALLREFAKVRFPNSGVSALAGDEWLAFLDAHGSDRAFREGPGSVLAWLPYSRHYVMDCSGLLDAVRHWLRANR